MLKTGLAKLAVIVVVAVVFVCSGCGKTLPLQVQAAGAITSTTTVITTTSASSPDQIPMPADLSAWKLTAEEAIAIASRYVPVEIMNHAKISTGIGANGNLKTGESRLYREVFFTNISITKNWLGWQSDSQTTLDSQEPYNTIDVYIDAVTGEYISRTAYMSVFIGGPGMIPAPITPWSPSLTTTSAPAQ